jgi:hypothetical protein
VLDNDSSGLLKLGGNAARRFQIHIVVVRKLFALKLFGGGQSRWNIARGNIKSGGLMRIFAVTQRLLLFQRKVKALRQCLFRNQSGMSGRDRQTFQFGGDHSVIARGGSEDLAR